MFQHTLIQVSLLPIIQDKEDKDIKEPNNKLQFIRDSYRYLHPKIQGNSCIKCLYIFHIYPLTMSSKTGPQYTHEFLILEGKQTMKQEGANELNSKEEEQSVDETMLSRMLQFVEEKDQLKDKLLASKDELLASKDKLFASKDELRALEDEQIKSMKTIGELCCENVQLKEQLAMAKETIKEQASRINQLEEERNQQQQEMNNIRFSTQQRLLDHATKQNDINDMEKQLLREKEELKEVQEKYAKAEEELRQKQLELDNRAKEVKQREERLNRHRKLARPLKKL
ncbi:hypothetical protein BDF22DRAFT_42031 [Syncephalis plumigaleata]|nr:hypothetical protein BDF22DRAFT_42031 [Syncephalis plumigaleata]